MRRHALVSFVVAIGLLSACNQAKSPDQVAADTARAEQKADNEVAKAVDSASADLGKAADKVNDDLTSFNNDAARDAYKLAVAHADGERRVSLAKCEAASGDAQKTCKDQTDADFQAAKAQAKAAAQSLKQ